MGILDLVNDIINEHGSANIRGERIAALKDAIVQLEKENAALNSAIICLKSDMENVKQENRICQERLNHIHSVTLNENHERVLLAVANYSGQPPGVFAQATGLSKENVTAKLNYLSSLGLLHFRSGYSVIQDGQR